MSYKSETQNKNVAWFLPRPHPSHYKGGMPLHCEKWLLELAGDMLGTSNYDLLSLFCGMCEFGTRVDLNPEVNPDIMVDVHDISSHFAEGFKFDVILADPPYSDEEAKELYGDLPKLNYKKWTGEADKLLRPRGLLIVYHKYVMPNPDPKKYTVAKRVFIGNRIYHIPRVATYFLKHGIKLI